MGRALSLLPLLAAALTVQAELRTDEIFADHMVLQQGRKVPISGTCTGSAAVKVSFAGQTVRAKISGGEWRAVLHPMQASSEGRAITITQGEEKLVINDVLVGEVWLASGQSNMLWRLNQTGDTNSLREPGRPLFRFHHSEPQVHTAARPYTNDLKSKLAFGKMFQGTWTADDVSTRARMSAVGYYFGRELQQQLGVPVGVIHASLGGSEMMAWMPTMILRKKYKECLSARWLDSKYISAWVRGRARQNIGNNLEAPHPYKPAYLFETGIRPWLSFPIAGVIWYQGESDAEIPNMRQNYDLLRDLISGWRSAFFKSDMPFLMVGLPRINDRSRLRAYWPEFRTIQLMAQQNIPGVHTLTTIDLGSTNSDVHPPRKLEVGTRLAHLAAAQVYGRDIPFSGPVVSKVSRAGSELILHYKHAEGLTTTDGAAPVGFEVSANGKFYHPATAVIKGSTIKLSSPQVPAPKYARYAWATFMTPNLVNAHGLPAVPYSPTNH